MSSVPLQDANIWDDSALIRSWDEAVDEYRRYHSIHARGEKVEEVLAEYADATQSIAVEGAATSTVDDDVEYAKDMTGSRIATTNGATREDVLAEVEPSNVNSSRGPLNGNQSEQPQASAPKSVTFPQALPRMDQDPAMQNLMMSWYYAGYYTGLYEGQQRQVNMETTNSGMDG